VLLVAGQAASAWFAGVAFLAGAAVSGIVAAGYLVRLRNAALTDRRHVAAERRAAAERARRRALERARRHRAETAVRRALRQVPAGPGLEQWLGDPAVRQAATWLAVPRQRRSRPVRDVVRVLAATGREAYRADDGWGVRTVAAPPVERRHATARPAATGLAPAVND
jgi:hypothetical protein